MDDYALFKFGELFKKCNFTTDNSLQNIILRKVNLTIQYKEKADEVNNVM